MPFDLTRPPGGGVAFFTLLSAALAVLKVLGVISLSWWLIAAPFLGIVTIALAVGVALVLMTAGRA